MKVCIIDDPALIRIDDGDPKNGIEGTAYIMREDVEGAKQFAAELRREPNATVRRLWEKEYYRQTKEKFASAHVAGALLQKVWDWTKDEEVSY